MHQPPDTGQIGESRLRPRLSGQARPQATGVLTQRTMTASRAQVTRIAGVPGQHAPRLLGAIIPVLDELSRGLTAFVRIPPSDPQRRSIITHVVAHRRREGRAQRACEETDSGQTAESTRHAAVSESADPPAECGTQSCTHVSDTHRGFLRFVRRSPQPGVGGQPRSVVRLSVMGCAIGAADSQPQAANIGRCGSRVRGPGLQVVCLATARDVPFVRRTAIARPSARRAAGRGW